MHLMKQLHRQWKKRKLFQHPSLDLETQTTPHSKHKRWLVVIAASMVLLNTSHASGPECVILLHGLARTADSMNSMSEHLAKHGYHTVNVNYPSREQPVEVLAPLALEKGITSCNAAKTSGINIVTHSLGGILVRHYFNSTANAISNTSNSASKVLDNKPIKPKRVVMLGPPNQGSQVVDNLKEMPGFTLLNGPTGHQLGTDAASIPLSLGPVDYEVGIIAGTRTINPILSLFLPKPNDGKVAVSHTKVTGMCSFVTIPATHTFMMSNETVLAETLHFLRHGTFSSDHASNHQCSTD